MRIRPWLVGPIRLGAELHREAKAAGADATGQVLDGRLNTGSSPSANDPCPNIPDVAGLKSCGTVGFFKINRQSCRLYLR